MAPRAPLTKLPVLAATVYDVLPLDARLDRVGLIDSATGELGPSTDNTVSGDGGIGLRPDTRGFRELNEDQRQAVTG